MMMMMMMMIIIIIIILHFRKKRLYYKYYINIILYFCINDPKHHQIFAQVLKVDKENPIKQVRQKCFLCHLFIEKKWSIVAYLCIAEVCESLGLAGNLKVKLRVHLFRGVFKQWDDYQVSLPALFNLKNRDLSKLIMFVEVNHGTTKEISEDLRNSCCCYSSCWKMTQNHL